MKRRKPLSDTKRKWSTLRQKNIDLDKERARLTLNLARMNRAMEAATESLAQEDAIASEAAWSRLQGDRLRSSQAQTDDPDREARSSGHSSFLLVGSQIPATGSTIRDELDPPDEEATEEC